MGLLVDRRAYHTFGCKREVQGRREETQSELKSVHFIETMYLPERAVVFRRIWNCTKFLRFD